MRVERLQREFDIDVEWRPFELHPEIPAAGYERAPRTSPRPEGSVSPIRQLALDEGLTFEPSSHVSNSHASLEAAEFAREHGAFDAFHRALFATYFGEGRDIGDASLLAKIAVASGLEGDALSEALASKRYAGIVDEQTAESRRDGITGTPTFIFERGETRFPLVGAQDYAVFENVARRMGAAPITG